MAVIIIASQYALTSWPKHGQGRVFMNYCTFYKISLVRGLFTSYFKNTTQFAELLNTLSFPISSPGIQIIFLNQK